MSLHKFIFENEEDRNNRQQLRQFIGFTYDEEDARYISKLSYINNNLMADLLAICIILGVDLIEVELQKHIFKNLCSDSLLADLLEDDDDNEDDKDGDEDDDKDDDEDEDEGGGAEAEYRGAVNVRGRITNHDRQRRNQSAPMFALNFRDVEDSIRPFDGSSAIPIKNWIQEFSQPATLMRWDQFQMMIFAKRHSRDWQNCS